MLRSLVLLTGGLLFLLGELQGVSGVIVEISELQLPDEEEASGEYEGTTFSNRLETSFTGEDPIDADCPAAGKCIGLLTRDGSLDLDSRYGCTEPPEPSPDDTRASRGTCGVQYTLLERGTRVISSVRVALHPNSISKLTVRIDGKVAAEEWDAAPGQSELQEIPGLKGFEGSSVTIDGVVEIGEYFAILETEIYVDVEEVEIAGVSASSRASITATATADKASVMNTVDGDSSDASSWTCSSGEVCVITYDLEAVESLKQLRIAFSESSTAGGTLNVMAAGESGVFSTVREGIDAGGRPVGSDGLQTFGGVRALARYVQIEVFPASGGPVVINEVEFRVGSDAPARPVAKSTGLKPTGPLPLVAGERSNPRAPPEWDIRTAANGGCNSPVPYDGCHVYYIKDGDMDSRWSCGPLAMGTDDSTLNNGCNLNLGLNYFRYLRQIQFAFHLGDERHEEFSIEADTPQGTVTVVTSAISSGDSTDYQTFDLPVFASSIRVVPKYQKVNQFFSIKEMNILELRRNEFIPGAGVVPVYFLQDNFDLDGVNEVSTLFSFDIPEPMNFIRFRTPSSTVTAIRMKFPADIEFTFAVEYSPTAGRSEDITEEFTSAGGPTTWETFTLSVPGFARVSVELIAVDGPTFVRFPDYPTLRVVDFEMVGELISDGPGHFEMVTTTMTEWGVIPDIIGDGVSEQEEIMTTICEAKGSTYDGTDCVGELDDSTVYINMQEGNYFLDGPVFVKSGVTLSGTFNAEGPALTFFILYEGDNNGNTAEEGVIVIDGVTDAEVEKIDISRNFKATGQIVPGTIGNLDMDVKNSQALRFRQMSFGAGRIGSARFTDSSNIDTFLFSSNQRPETGVYMELTRVDDFSVRAFGTMHGLLMDTCNNIVWEGLDDFEIPDPRISAPAAGGGQTANVVLTGNSSNITIKDCDIRSSGAEPLILMESTMPLTLDAIEYDEAVSGDCIVQVDPATTEDLIVQVNAKQTLSKSGDCWLLD